MMETKIYTTRDRTGWPSGPWDNEPDKMQWADKNTGLPCLAVRNFSGAWCGYVGVPDTHPMHGAHYDEVNADAHGGLTFSGACRPGAEEHGICHIPEPGEPDNVWWLGFDCAHLGDKCPQPRFHGPEFDDEVYRTLEYVQAECTRLAAQLKKQELVV